MNDDIEARLKQLEDRLAKMEGERGRIRAGLATMWSKVTGKQLQHDAQIARQDGRIAALETWRAEVTGPGDKGDTAQLNQLRLLRYLINQHFNDEELRGLVFDLGVDYDSLRKNGKDTTTRELISYCERRGRLGKLVTRCQELRADVMGWPVLFDDVEWL